MSIPPASYNQPAPQKPMSPKTKLVFIAVLLVFGFLLLIGGGIAISGFVDSGTRPHGRGALGFPLFGIIGGLTSMIAGLVLGIRLAVKH